MLKDTTPPPPFTLTEGYRRYVLAILIVAYTLNYLDRQLITILLEPIKLEFGFSDGQLGILTGIAFALFYTVLGVPLARYADKHSRVKLIAASLFVWSFFTAATGLARSYLQMFLARLCVGIGEAGCSPAAYSLLSDYYPPNRRATAISCYSLGVPIGTFLGLLFGGMIAQYYGWRAAFFIAGAPGLVIAFVVYFTVKRIPRGFSDAQRTDSARGPSTTEVLKVLWSRRSFRHMALAAALHSFVGYGAGNFIPSYFMRTYGMNYAETGLFLAAAAIMSGVGIYLGGYFSDRLAQGRADYRWYLWVPAISTAALLPVGFVVFLSPSQVVGMTAFAMGSIFAATFLGPTVAMSQAIVSVRARALAAAVLLFVNNLIGLGLGPLLTGYLSDFFREHLVTQGMELIPATRFGLTYALMAIWMVNLWSAIHYLLACRTLRKDIAAASDC